MKDPKDCKDNKDENGAKLGFVRGVLYGGCKGM